jgi:GT2 family glycosyltransferase
MAPDALPEREAWQTLLNSYLPLVERLPASDTDRDPLALPCALDTRGILGAAEDEREPGQPSVDVVVCVHNALTDLRRCIGALLSASDRVLRLILVNDGSDSATSDFLRTFAARHPAVTLIHRRTPPHGYTIAANRGLRASSGDYVVLLNSDTVVAAGWLGKLVDYGEAHPAVGILSPLSNAASHQSVPSVRDSDGWAVNRLPDWLTVDGMDLVVERGTPRVDARLPFLNGFCYAIKRAVIETIGLFDEARFASGYCEENDYSHRARQAGFQLAVLDDVYVHHAKSSSFGAGGRARLARHNYELFLAKHDRDELQQLVAELEADQSLEPVRAAVRQHSASPRTVAALLGERTRRPLSIVFLLPGLAHGGSGGSHSIYQEVRGLRSLGVPARILLPRWDEQRAAAAYEDAADIFQTFTDTDELVSATADADVISATHYKSVALLQAIHAVRSDFLPAYYVQDYEPFFTPPYIAAEAIASYTALTDMLLFAKSHWLCNVVAERHGLHVAKVQPSIDEQLFHVRPAAEGGDSPGALRVSAMIRPRTARRQPQATVDVLTQLLAELPGQVRVRTFGCYPDELRELAPHATAIHERHLGLLSRHQVAELLRDSDVFLDMSVYQAFGRTALEAMACGATAIVPNVGGAGEFVEHERNALAVDTFDARQVIAALRSLAEDAPRLQGLRQHARATAARHSIARAALSEYLLFERAHRAHLDSNHMLHKSFTR